MAKFILEVSYFKSVVARRGALCVIKQVNEKKQDEGKQE